jgi:hypothetical protein
VEALPLTALRTLDLEGEGPKFVACASGLAWTKEWFHVVADDALFLASYPVQGRAPGRRLALFAGALPDDHSQRKAHKPDLESLCVIPRGEKWMHGALLAIPSGSTPARRQGAWVLVVLEDALGQRREAADRPRALHAVAGHRNAVHHVLAGGVVIRPFEVVEGGGGHHAHLVAGGQPPGQPPAVQLGAPGHLEAVALDDEAQPQARAPLTPRAGPASPWPAAARTCP